MVSTDSKLGLLWRLEVRLLLRDRRAMIMAFLLPLLMLPLVLWLGRMVENQGEEQALEEPLGIVFSGPAGPWVEQQLLPTVTAPAAWQGRVVEDPFSALAEGDVDLVIQGRWLVEGSSVGSSAPAEGSGNRGTAALDLFFRADRGRSNRALETLQEQLLAARYEVRRGLMRDAGSTFDLEQVLVLDERDVASKAQVAASQLGRWLTLAILLFVVVGGSVVAGDTLAGEKERGTLETLLTSSVERRQIGLAKLLAILTFGVLVAGVQLLNLFVHLAWLMEDPPRHFAVELTPGRLLLLVVLFLPLLTTAAGAMLWVSGRAQSYREFHFYLLPLAVVLLLPTTAAALPGASLTAGWMLLPMANLSLAIRAVLTGHFVWSAVAGAWFVTATLAAWVVRATLADVMSEDQLSSTEKRREEVVLQPFERHVGHWFAGFWIFIFLALVYVPLFSSFIVQLLLNLVLVCLGGSWLLIGVYRLEPRQVFGSRRPAEGIWPLVLVGAPALTVLNGAIYRWTMALFPVSRQALESSGLGIDIGRLSSLELLTLVAVLPAICEELAFRGVLLNGLRRRLPEAQLCLVVGVVFAMFHFDLARGLPTLFLGAILAWLTLRSGSVYPAMAWHGANNALVLWANERGTSLGTLHPAVCALAAVALSWVLWRLWRQPPPAQGTVM